MGRFLKNIVGILPENLGGNIATFSVIVLGISPVFVPFVFFRLGYFG